MATLVSNSLTVIALIAALRARPVLNDVAVFVAVLTPQIARSSLRGGAT
ncbi:MAG: hypothetical protein ACXVRP_14055 [Solirubrobacteraceae bacterium]